MKNKKGKRLLISLIALVLVAAIGGGIFFAAQNGGESVGVYSFDYVGMTEYWGDSQESYGPVTTDRIQTVFLSDTQTVTEVLVKEGDQVKKGDTLMTFDTTLSDLQLERKRLEVEKLKLQLDEANDTLKKIRNMVPMEPLGDFEFEIPQEELGNQVNYPYDTWFNKTEKHDGTSLEQAFICWIPEGTYIDDVLLEELRRVVWGREDICSHNLWSKVCPTCNPEICEHDIEKSKCEICNCSHGANCEICNPCVHGIIEAECEICNPEICEEHKQVKALCPICTPQCIHGDGCVLCNPCEHGLIPQLCPQCFQIPCVHGSSCEICVPSVPEPDRETEPEEGAEGGTETTPEPTAATEAEQENSGAETNNISAFSETPWFIRFLSNTEDSEETQPPAEDSQPEPSGQSYFVIFKSTQDDREFGALTRWQGLHVVGRQGRGTAEGEPVDFAFDFFDPVTADYAVPETDEEQEATEPEIDFQVGYTAKQLLEMRREQEKKIKDLEFQIKVADNAYKIMLKEVNDGNIRAEFDGEVVSVLTEEEAKNMRQPVLKVSGGGGFYIEGSVSELEKDNLVLGQEVTVNDWNTGSTYTGKIDSIGDFPTSDRGWNGMGNPNATYFPFLVFVDGEADLQAGSYVSVQYSAAESNHGIYLQKAFLRTEKGESFVYVLGEEDRLEKRIVTTGKSLWGSYIEVLSGITPEDKIAFPYGKDIKEGAKAEERDIGSLYGY